MDAAQKTEILARIADRTKLLETLEKDLTRLAFKHDRKKEKAMRIANEIANLQEKLAAE